MTTRTKVGVALTVLAVCWIGAVGADEGRIEINQVSAEAGGITASDAPGFPVTIDSPGSYVLTGDLVLSGSSANVIDISASGVSLDLNGFRIEATTGTVYAVFVNDVADTTIRNGLVIHPGSSGKYGIELYKARNYRIVDMRFRIAGTAVNVEGSGSGSGAIAESVFEAYTPGARAVSVSTGTVAITNNTTRSCDMWVGASGSLVRGNVIGGLQNSLIVTGDFNLIEDNLMVGGGGWGLFFGATSNDNVYRRNVARNNGGTVGTCTNSVTSDLCDEGIGNTSHGDNYLPSVM